MKTKNNLFSLKNKVVLITGAGRGIGQHLAEKIVEQNAIVYAIDKNFPKTSKRSMKNLFKIRCDITDQDAFKQVCVNIVRKKKRIDVLINNAGIGLGGPLLELPVDIIRKLFEVNLFGLIEVTKSFFLVLLLWYFPTNIT